MHLQKNIKILLYFLVVFVMLFLVYAFYLGKPLDYSKVTKQIEKNLQFENDNVTKKIAVLKKYFYENNLPELYDKVYKSGLILEDCSFFIFKDDSVIFWSNNFFPVDDFCKEDFVNSKIIHASNGWYLSNVLEDKNYCFVGLFLVKSEFTYQNQFLNNSLNQHLTDNTTDVKISSLRKIYNVFSVNNDFLFSVDFSGKPEASILHETILFILFLICFSLVICCFLLFVSNYLINKTFLNRFKFVLLAIIIFIFRYILFKYRLPDIIFSLKIFSPQYFASSSFLPSLGDLILNVLCFFIFSYFLIKEVKPDKTIKENKFYNSIVVFLLIPFCFALFYFLYDSFEKIIINSNIYFLFNNFFELTVYSFWSFFVFCLLLISTFFIIFKFFKLFLFVFKNNKVHYVLIIASIVVCISAIFLYKFKFDFYYFSGILPFLILILFQIKKGISPNRFSSIILYVLLFAFFSTYIIYKFSDFKEKERRKLIAQNLVSETDPIAEYLFSDIQNKILADKVLTKYLDKHIENEILINKYLHDKYFSGYWSKYDIQFTICCENDNLVIKPEDIEVNCNNFFKNIKENTGNPTITENLYQINQVSGRNSYLAEIPVVTNSEGKIVTLYIEFLSKFIPKQLGYPELLIDKSVKINKNLLNYNYAKYKNKELIMQYGKFFYYLNSANYKPENKSIFFFNLKGYNHMYYKVDDSTELIISIKDTDIIDIIATFSYLFIIYCIIWFILKLVLFSPKFIRSDFFNFSNRVRFAMFFVVIISFISIGFFTFKFIIKIYNNKNYDNISEKAHSVLIEMENKLSKVDTFTPELCDYATELLVNFSNVFFTDINLYDLNGNLIASSRYKIFSEGLISRKMNAEAFHNMTTLSKTFYIHDENIGSLNYLSAYIPFSNDDNKCVAYINLPYFAKQSEQNKEISSFLAAFINIYVFLIAFSIIIAVLISRYITKPLQLIKEKLSRFQLGKVNEKIIWNKQDEIGSLVNEYNRLIDELAKSVSLLAQSERESAWREMAKQVAHEIKNPLTPMKLSVQHLQRTLKDKPEEWDERLDKFTHMMIDQIDTLSSIATSFSDFAKMPVAENVVLDLNDVVAKSIIIYKDITNVEFIFQKPVDSQCLVMADEMQLKRAFGNLIKNSLQAIDEKVKGVIIIGIEQDNNNYRITFNDNGKGISIEEAKKIFVPSFTTKTSGMGLGLAIVKNIIEGFKGSITFESEFGKGTTFIITLPVFEKRD